MSLEEKFNQTIEEWRKFAEQPCIQVSSSMRQLFESDAYVKLATMGKDALPLIRKLYEHTKEGTGIGSKNKGMQTIVFHGLPHLIGTIVGGDNYQVPEEISGRMAKIREFTIKWLDEHGYR